MLTNYENLLSGLLATVQEELSKAVARNNYLEDKVKEAKESEDRWYRHYSDRNAEVKRLEEELAELKSLTEQKKELNVPASNSSENLKEVI